MPSCRGCRLGSPDDSPHGLFRLRLDHRRPRHLRQGPRQDLHRPFRHRRGGARRRPRRSPPGEIFGFLGPNGAGKSTTVRMLTTLTRITGGSASVAGVDVAADPDEVRRKIGVALQEAGPRPAPDGPRAARAAGPAVRHVAAPRRASRAGELLELVELDDAADRLIKGYSGGMKRRLDLASALVHEPGRPLPRRADHRARPSEPARGVGRGAPHQRSRAPRCS